ncbi:hypothetical protein McpCs1_15690 [Methanocorpusculaceae archaeon Cs1]|uniref:Uncharacterized protein n=1 Tax=Methanorbis rubei TaxID=3028300 RepID=A0AAE4MI08_9EURY|nr:hypothetical protein [Methanocorpusculaceae archaeon Cs1]
MGSDIFQPNVTLILKINLVFIDKIKNAAIFIHVYFPEKYARNINQQKSGDVW